MNKSLLTAVIMGAVVIGTPCAYAKSSSGSSNSSSKSAAASNAADDSVPSPPGQTSTSVTTLGNSYQGDYACADGFNYRLDQKANKGGSASTLVLTDKATGRKVTLKRTASGSGERFTGGPYDLAVKAGTPHVVSVNKKTHTDCKSGVTGTTTTVKTKGNN